MTDMSDQPGSIYKIGGQRYVDSQAVLNLSRAHEVVAHHDGWRVIVDDGAVQCARVEDRPELPRQRGVLYELSAQGGASLKTQRAAWLSQGLLESAGTFDTWPGEPPAKAGCGCGKTCGCAPCRLQHGHHHDHEETP